MPFLKSFIILLMEHFNISIIFLYYNCLNGKKWFIDGTRKYGMRSYIFDYVLRGGILSVKTHSGLSLFQNKV